MGFPSPAAATKTVGDRNDLTRATECLPHDRC